MIIPKNKGVIMYMLSTVLAAIICAASPITAQENLQIQTEQAEIQLGTDTIGMIRLAYEDGQYDDFLKEMDQSYKQVKDDNRLKGLADIRTTVTPALDDQQKWNELAAQLQKEKNEQLLDAIAKEKSSAFIDKVKRAATNPSTQEQEKAIAQLAEYRYMAPGSGKNDDENVLIDLDLEYEYKMIHLDMPVIDGKSISDRKEKQYALRMEKMERMVEASKNFQDESLKKTVELASANFDERMAQFWDASELSAMAKGKTKPSSAIEEKVVSILNSHQAKFNDLAKQYINELAQHEAKK